MNLNSTTLRAAAVVTRSVKWWILSLLWGLCLPAAEPKSAGAPGAEAPAPDFTKLSLEDLGAIEIPTVVGASKHEQKVTDAPSSVSLITRDEIQKFGYRNLSDVLRAVRDFYVTYDRTYSYVGVRGFNRPGDFGGRTLVLIDGHRTNEPLFDSAFTSTDFLLDLDLIDRVEVVRGPGSVLYGNNAFFGIINIVTRKGAALNGVEVSTAAGSFDTYSGRVSYGKVFKNDLELLVSGSWYDSHGMRRLYVPDFNTPDQNNGIAQDNDKDKAQRFFTSLRYHNISLEGGFVSRQKDSPLAPYETYFNDPRQHPIDQQGFVSIRWEETTPSDWNISTRAYYDFYGLAVDYPSNVATPPALPSIVLNQERDSAQWAGIETQFAKQLWEKHRLTFGAEFRHDFSLTIHSEDLNPPALVADVRETANRVGAFTEMESSIFTNLSITAGGRYDYYSTFGSALNPRVALIYNPWNKASWKFLFGEAYRAPNLWEADFRSSVQKGNPNLKPETIRTYELVYEQYLRTELRSSVSVFLNQARDLILQDTDPGDGLLYYRNESEAETKGASAELEYRSKKGFLARTSYSIQRTVQVGTGEELSNSPRHLAKANISIPIYEQKVFLSSEIQYSSRVLNRPAVLPSTTGSYWVMNTTLFSRNLLKNLEASASVYNVLNRKYSYPLGDEYLPAAILQDGRTFQVKLTYRF